MNATFYKGIQLFIPSSTPLLLGCNIYDATQVLFNHTKETIELQCSFRDKYYTVTIPTAECNRKKLTESKFIQHRHFIELDMETQNI